MTRGKLQEVTREQRERERERESACDDKDKAMVLTEHRSVTWNPVHPYFTDLYIVAFAGMKRKVRCMCGVIYIVASMFNSLF